MDPKPTKNTISCISNDYQAIAEACDRSIGIHEIWKNRYGIGSAEVRFWGDGSPS